MFSYYSAVIFFAIFVMVIMSFLLGCNDFMERKQKLIFYFILTMVIIASISEWFGVFLDGKAEWARIPHIIFKVIEFIIAPIIPVTCIIVIKGYEYTKRIIPLIIMHTFIEILSGFFGFIFYIDNANVYHHGTFYWIYILAYLSGTLFFEHHAFKVSKKYYGLSKLVLWSILIFIFSGIAIQTITTSIRVDWLCISIDILIFYIFYSELMQQLDAVTGLLNRTSYDNKISRINSPTIILFFDIDDFKSINDNYGHSFGDYCLKTVGSTLHEAYEKVGRCYRIGGDEFCAILNIKRSEVDEYNSALFHLLDIERYKDARIPYISVGYSYFNPSKEILTDAIEIADAMMYHNKKINKNARKVIKETSTTYIKA